MFRYLVKLTEVEISWVRGLQYSDLLAIVYHGIFACNVFIPISFVVSDEIDIMGYGSATSDTDDHSSVESSSSDGFTIAVKRVRLNSSLSESL